MKDLLSINDLKKQVVFFKNIFAYCLNDIEKMQHNNNVIYNIDFQFLFPYIFNNEVENVKPFMPQYSKIFGSLAMANEHNVKFDLSFSGASFLELLDQIEHRRNYYHYSLEELTRYCDKYASGSKLSNNIEMLAKRKDILHSIKIISEQGFIENITVPLNKMVNLIKGGSLTPLGEFIKGDIVYNKEYKKKFDSDLDVMIKNRLPYENRRSDLDAIFHYKVDVLNVLLSYAVNKEMPNNYLLFTTATKENISLCKIEGESYGRNPCVPLFLLNSKILKERKFLRSSREFIEEGLLHANKVLERLTGIDDYNDLPLFDFRKILEFYEFYIHNLNQETLKLTTNYNQPTKEEIMEILSDPSRLNSTFENAESSLKESASELYNYYKELDDNVIGEFDLEEDPIVKKIKLNLGLK